MGEVLLDDREAVGSWASVGMTIWLVPPLEEPCLTTTTWLPELVVTVCLGLELFLVELFLDELFLELPFLDELDLEELFFDELLLDALDFEELLLDELLLDELLLDELLLDELLLDELLLDELLLDELDFEALLLDELDLEVDLEELAAWACPSMGLTGDPSNRVRQARRIHHKATGLR